MENDRSEFPEGLVPVGKNEFNFNCHPDVPCFTNCCKRVELILYPYDAIRLKNILKIDSEKFLYEHVNLIKGNNPYFPSLMLKLDEDEFCPFLKQSGCSVYVDRPSACRTYPLERAVNRKNEKAGRPEDFYFLTNHDYCHGHKEEKIFTVKSWLRNQRIDEFNSANDLWTSMDTLFAENPWKGEGVGGSKQQMAFMICYNIDGFRRFCEESHADKQFKLNKDQRRRMDQDDLELQKFGFEWLKLILTGKSSLVGR